MYERGHRGHIQTQPIKEGISDAMRIDRMGKNDENVVLLGTFSCGCSGREVRIDKVQTEHGLVKGIGARGKTSRARKCMNGYEGAGIDILGLNVAWNA